MFTLVSLPFRFLGWLFIFTGVIDVLGLQTAHPDGGVYLAVGIGCVWLGRHIRDVGVARRIAREVRRQERIDRMVDDLL